MPPEHRIRNEVTPPRASHCMLVACGAVVTLLGAVLVALPSWALATVGAPQPGMRALMLLIVVCAVVVIVLGTYLAVGMAVDMWVWNRGESRLTPDGVVVRGVRHRTLPWAEIADIVTVRRMGAWRIVLTLRTGGRVYLPAPNLPQHDWNPRFPEHAATIRAWWEHYG